MLSLTLSKACVPDRLFGSLPVPPSAAARTRSSQPRMAPSGCSHSCVGLHGRFIRATQ